MDALPVQYVTTSDDIRIAFVDSGVGMPVVITPFTFNFVGDITSMGPWGQFVLGLARDFHVIFYDGRGQGLSSRGLPQSVTREDFERDLEAIVNHLTMTQFVLIGNHYLSHMAVRYAVRHPDQIRGLVLQLSALKMTALMSPASEVMAAADWEFFLYQSAAMLNAPNRSQVVANLERCTTQADHLTRARVWRESSIQDVVGEVSCPTLVVQPTGRTTRDSGEVGMELARRLRNGSLFIMSPDQTPETTLETIKSFVLEVLAVPDGRPGISARISEILSSREVEVLRLLAAGKSNQEIAEALVISPNTVAKHVSSILGKTESANRVEATTYAHRHGLV